mmetsp:Transcript_122560/g.261534  ORF Transcript_122560/g.261534 Transcript_122560/m.261534 type:complete len:211 (+) Transcript_122560:401-1033(+)
MVGINIPAPSLLLCHAFPLIGFHHRHELVLCLIARAHGQSPPSSVKSQPFHGRLGRRIRHHLHLHRHGSHLREMLKELDVVCRLMLERIVLAGTELRAILSPHILEGRRLLLQHLHYVGQLGCILVHRQHASRRELIQEALQQFRGVLAGIPLALPVHVCEGDPLLLCSGVGALQVLDLIHDLLRSPGIGFPWSCSGCRRHSTAWKALLR